MSVKNGLVMRSFIPGFGLAAAFFMLRLCVSAQDASLPPDTAFNPTAGRGDIIWIKVRSDTAEDYMFGVDTGGTLTVLDKSWERKLEPRPFKHFDGARWPISGVFAAPSLLLGGVRLLTPDTIATQDLAAHFPGHPVAGILGMDCLGHYCLQFDFSENKIRFLDPRRLNEQDLGKPFPMEPIRGCFFVNGTVVGVNGLRSLIDTGCNFDGVLTPDLFGQWTNQAQSSAAAPAALAHFPDGVFGGAVYTNLYLAGDGAQNLVGLHFLARNLVTLNFPGRMLYLRQQSAGPVPGEEGVFAGFYKRAFQTH
jgi:hypothetical protein